MRSLFSKMPKSFAFVLKWLIRISLQVPTVVARHGRIKFSLILVFYHFHISMKSFLTSHRFGGNKVKMRILIIKKEKEKKASSVTFMRSFGDSFSASYPQAPRNSLLCDCHENSGRPAGQLWLRRTYFINAEMHHRSCSVILVVQNLEYQLKKTPKNPGCVSRRFLDFE